MADTQSKRKAAADKAAAEEANKGRRVKYMGSADIRMIEKGDTFNGQLPDGLEASVRWDWDNHHIVDLDELGLSEESIELILEEADENGSEFQEVTGMKRVPVNLAQVLFRGAKPNARIEPGKTLPTQDTDLEENRRVQSSGGHAAPSGVSVAGSGAATPDPARSTPGD